MWNAPAYPDQPLTAPEKARGPWTTKDYLSRVLQETSNEMVDALLAATQADLINAFCRMLSISGCFLLFAVRRPRREVVSKGAAGALGGRPRRARPAGCRLVPGRGVASSGR